MIILWCEQFDYEQMSLVTEIAQIVRYNFKSKPKNAFYYNFDYFDSHKSCALVEFENGVRTLFDLLTGKIITSFYALKPHFNNEQYQVTTLGRILMLWDSSKNSMLSALALDHEISCTALIDDQVIVGDSSGLVHFFLIE